ncbi:hypothetical protein GCM10023238_11640 [Streptomyces heliomycini]
MLTCIEEIDHGLHPHVLSLLTLRLREASARGQFLVTTHSPVLVNALEPEELIVCERLPSGASRIPARSLEDIQRIIEKSEYEPMGDLWYSGALGGACGVRRPLAAVQRSVIVVAGEDPNDCKVLQHLIPALHPGPCRKWSS